VEQVRPVINERYGPDLPEKATIKDLFDLKVIPSDVVVYDAQTGDTLKPEAKVKDHPKLGYIGPWEEG
jgi:hypothetical protein